MIITLPNEFTAKADESNGQIVNPSTTQENLIDNNTVEQDQTESTDDPQIIGEDTSKRTLDSKTFVMSDRSFMSVIYDENVHYYENGEYKDIDNTLQNSTEEDSTDLSGYENKDNSFKVKFAKQAGGKYLVRVKSGNYKMVWDYINTEKQDNASIFKGTEKKRNSKLDKYKIKKNDSGVTYTDIEQGIDLQYLVNGSNIKENIVVKQARENYSFPFSLNLKNLEAKQNGDGSISVYDPKTDKEQYCIPLPYMYDADGNISYSVKYELSKENKYYNITVIADQSTVNSMTFPVTIDPAITTDLDQSAISCTYVDKNHASANHNEELELLVGNDSYSYGSTRAYLKFTLPTLNKGDMVINADMNLCQYDDSFYSSGTDNLQVNAYAVNATWNPTSLTWSNQPAYNSTILDYNYITRTSGWKSWDITKVVKDWYDGDIANNGIMLKANNESTDWAAYGVMVDFGLINITQLKVHILVLALIIETIKGWKTIGRIIMLVWEVRVQQVSMIIQVT